MLLVHIFTPKQIYNIIKGNNLEKTPSFAFAKQEIFLRIKNKKSQYLYYMYVYLITHKKIV